MVVVVLAVSDVIVSIPGGGTATATGTASVNGSGRLWSRRRQGSRRLRFLRVGSSDGKGLEGAKHAVEDGRIWRVVAPDEGVVHMVLVGAKEVEGERPLEAIVLEDGEVAGDGKEPNASGQVGHAEKI